MSKLFNLFFIFALVAALLGSAVTYTPARAAGILYVKPEPTGSGNCTSWENACLLQVAINRSSFGDQIWVQAGIHVPHISISDRYFSFTLKNAVAIYGGFAGWETDFSERDLAANETILSGDLNGDDNGFLNNDENLFTVVISDENNSSAILDGFTIRGGNANEDNFRDGGGMLNWSSPTLRNLIFSGNYAGSGGGLYNHGNPTLTNIIFSGNFSGGGGGLYNNGDPTLTNVTFLENRANSAGGMYNNGGNPTLTHVTFDGNAAFNGGDGGGMYNTSGTNLTLTNVTFSGNSALFGGGMYNVGANLTLTNVIFSKNIAFEDGGGMSISGGNATLTNVTFSENTAHLGAGLLSNSTSPTLTNVTFSGNTAESGGGGMVNGGGSPVLTNVTFSGNTAFGVGGGMYNSGNGSPGLSNVTFSGNSAPNGGGMYNRNGSNPILINTLIADSPSGGDCVNVSSMLNATSSNNLIEDASKACGLTNGANGNIIGVDPKLGPLANNGGFTRTHALLPGSPALDKGTNVNCPATDQRGVTRPQRSHCDIGAYEARALTISGTAGAAGVTLSYTDGAPKTVTSQSNGNYSLIVSEGWSGTVTPSHLCYTFNPATRNHPNVTANLTAQNFSAVFNPGSTCAQVAVRLGPALQGTHVVAKNAGIRQSYPREGGPVFVNGTNSVPFVASERVLYPKGSNNPANFSEMMGLPANLRSTKYSFPAYDNLVFDSQLRFANVGNANTTVTVRIGGVLKGSYPLAPNQSTKVSYASLSGGPVVVQSTGNVPIIASLRVVTRPYNGSFSEMIGLPQSQVGTSYVFPWYNNATLDTQLRVGNIGTGTAQVTVTVGGRTVGRFSLGLNESKRFNFDNVNGGLVRVSSIGNIVASLRVAIKNPAGNWISFSEIMGLPESQTSTGYLFPWYNNATLDTQLRIANVGASPATVRVLIGGQEMIGSPFTLAAGASTRKSFPGVNNGPVVVRSINGVKLIAALRVVLPRGSNTPTMFSEMMGLPESQLTTSYIFPWYNNLGLDTQLRFGVP